MTQAEFERELLKVLPPGSPCFEPVRSCFESLSSLTADIAVEQRRSNLLGAVSSRLCEMIEPFAFDIYR